MLAGAVWSFRRGRLVRSAACLLMAAVCVYALMLAPARSEPALTLIARCEFFLQTMMYRRGLIYRPTKATERADPPVVTVEFETRNRAHAPGRSVIGTCEFAQDHRHISFITLDGLRAQIVYD
ncbi:hypothetical protein [Mesorhizobium silamurunense]|uniref:hypothetical protein n=1 Tax=Mesorhizobium silamurunense TaxID=499528 RepID=UPI00177B174E|nr:hypothetical protein [Mesorhizobium silamurunense]